MEKVIRTKVKDLLKSEPGQDVLAKGWVRTKRGHKNVAFIALNDAKTASPMSPLLQESSPSAHHPQNCQKCLS